MTPSTHRFPVKRAAAIVLGCALIAGVTATSAAYLDRAELNIGNGTEGSAIGHPGLFEVQVKDASGVWQDADDEPSAVLLPTTPDAQVGINDPIEFVSTTRIHPDSPKGDVLPSIYTAATCTGKCGDLFNKMLFTVTYDGAATPLAEKVTADEFNALSGRTLLNVQPGDEHTITVSVVLTTDTPPSWRGTESAFGLTFDGVTTP